MAPREVLVQRLAELLGFEDGAADVLEHLLSIESDEDLLDYLSQLLGRDDENVQIFVQDVGRFQRGEPLSSNKVDDDDNDAPPARPELTYAGKTTPAPSSKRKEKAQTPTKTKPVPKPVAASAIPKKPPATTKAPPTKTIATKNPPKSPQKLPPTALPPKSHPSKGSASVVCGCFGSVHKPLTNCLYCGRISCEREGYDFCPFCGLMVEKVETGGENSKALEHKERLLRFDREFARRTVVLDDQADYFPSNRAWLTEDEKEQAQEREAERHDRLHKRGNQKLDIAF